MSGASLKGKINRQNALDLQDDDDHAMEEKGAGERTDTASMERDPQIKRQQRLMNSQREGSLDTSTTSSAADSSFICNPQQTRNTWRHKLT